MPLSVKLFLKIILIKLNYKNYKQNHKLPFRKLHFNKNYTLLLQQQKKNQKKKQKKLIFSPADTRASANRNG